MIKRVDRKRQKELPRAVKSDGVMLCPLCWRVIAEPLSGEASIAIWCRSCKQHIILDIKEPESR